MSKGTLAPFPPALPAGLITGSGTTDFIPVWTGAQTQGNSLMKQVGGNVVLQGTAGLRVPKDLHLNTSKTNSFTALQMLGSVIDLNFSVDVTGSFWTINASAAAGKIFIDGNGELTLKAGNGPVFIQDQSGAVIDKVHLFPNAIATAIPKGLHISGRNSTDSAQRTLVIAMNPTIDNCVLFSGLGRYCFDDNLHIERGAAGNFTFSSDVTGDTNDRFVMEASGKMNWGTGVAATDTELLRAGIAKLRINNFLGINIIPLAALDVNGSINVTANNRVGAWAPTGTPETAIKFVDSGAGGEIITIYVNNGIKGSIDATGKWMIGSAIPASGLDINVNAGGVNMGYITATELTGDAGAPAANRFALYGKDVGGKTALFVRFNTGAVQQIAIEP